MAVKERHMSEVRYRVDRQWLLNKECIHYRDHVHVAIQKLPSIEQYREAWQPV